MADAETTEALILRVAAGERAALAALHARLGAQVYGLCRRFGAGRPDRLHAQVWAAIWQAAPDFAASRLTGDDWLVLVARAVILAAQAPPVQDDTARLADLPPLLPRQGALATCLAGLMPEDAEAVVRALEQGEREADLAQRFGLPVERMTRLLDGTLSAVDRCLGGDGGTAAARATLGLATPEAELAFYEAASDDAALRAARARWAHAVAGAFVAPPHAPPADAMVRITRRLFDDGGGGILRRLGLIPALVAALIGALFLVWIGGGDEPPAGETLAPHEAPEQPPG